MEKLSFEQSIARIEEIVRALEKGDVPLEQSLSGSLKRGQDL